MKVNRLSKVLQIRRMLAVLSAPLFLAPIAFAELDPELAQLSLSNPKGFFIGPSATVGSLSSDRSDESAPYWLAGVELGLAGTSEKWTRYEGSFLLSTGKSSQDDWVYNMEYIGVFRMSMGYGLGGNFFARPKIGVGLVSGSGETEEHKYLSSLGFVGNLGYDLLYITSDTMAFFGGVDFMHQQISLNKIKVKSTGLTGKVDGGKYHINMIGLNFGARFFF